MRKRKEKKKPAQESSSFQCPLEKCFQRKHCLGSQGKDLGHWRLLPRGKIPARMKKYASPLLCSCPPPTVLRALMSSEQDVGLPGIPLLTPRCTSSFSFPLPSSPFLRPLPPPTCLLPRHSPGSQDTGRDWATPPVILGDLYGKDRWQSIHSQCSRPGQCGPLAGPGPPRMPGDPRVKNIGFRAAPRGLA